MNLPHDHEDELQALWRKDDARQRKEDYTMMLALVREKGRTLHEFLRGEDKANYMLLFFVPILALIVWRSWVRSARLLFLGFLILTLTVIAGGVITWINARRAKAVLGHDRDLRAYQKDLLHFIDKRIQFQRTIKYWCGVLILLGVAFAAYPLARPFFTPLWSIVVIVSVCLTFAYLVWRSYDVKRVADLRHQKEEIQSLLRDMDEAE